MTHTIARGTSLRRAAPGGAVAAQEGEWLDARLPRDPAERVAPAAPVTPATPAPGTPSPAPAAPVRQATTGRSETAG